MSILQSNISNRLLSALSPSSFAKFADQLVPVDLPRHYKLAQPNTLVTSIIFPETGIVSIIGQINAIQQEIGLFGADGASSIFSVLSPRRATNLVVMQVPGVGHRVESVFLKSIFETDPELRELLLCYVEAFVMQISHTAIANVHCTIGERLARWLLMIQDRIDSDELSLTHEYVAAMLGVSRMGVTLALQHLVAEGLITTDGKLIRVESRRKLLGLAGKYYGGPETAYQNLMGSRIHK